VRTQEVQGYHRKSWKSLRRTCILTISPILTS
jgi:hypothetical protein